MDDFATRLLTYLDGTRTQPELVERLQADIETGDLTVGALARDPRGSARGDGELAANCARLLEVFARFGILDAPD